MAHMLPSGEIQRVKAQAEQKVAMAHRKYSSLFIPGKKMTQTVIGSLNSPLKKMG